MNSDNSVGDTNSAQRGMRSGIAASAGAGPAPGATGARPASLVVARRGQLTMTVLTLARARMAGIAVEPHATLVAVIHPDDRLFAAIGVEGLDLMRGLIGELQPRSVTVEGTQLEDVSLLREALLGPREMLEAL